MLYAEFVTNIAQLKLIIKQYLYMLLYKNLLCLVLVVWLLYIIIDIVMWNMMANALLNRNLEGFTSSYSTHFIMCSEVSLNVIKSTMGNVWLLRKKVHKPFFSV